VRKIGQEFDNLLNVIPDGQVGVNQLGVEIGKNGSPDSLCPIQTKEKSAAAHERFMVNVKRKRHTFQ